MKNFLAKILKINFLLLCVTLFFIRLPPVYLLPIGGSFFTSHSVSRYLSLFIFFSSFIVLYLKNQKLKIDKKLSLLLLFYFTTQSLSVIRTINLEQFLLVYKNIIFGILVFFVSLLVVDSKNIRKLIIIFLITGLINIVLEILIYFYPHIIYDYLQPIFDQKYWIYFDYQFRRARFFTDILDEAVIPIIFYYLIVGKRLSDKFFLLIYIATISFFSLVSNWRFKVVILVFSLTTSCVFFFKKVRNYLIPLGIFIIFFLFFAYIISLKIVGFNTLDRLLMSEKRDVESITSRFSFWDESIAMGLSSPLFGVGLGNYFDNLEESEKIIRRSFLNPSTSQTIVYDPHNIFFSTLANTGFLGLLSYIFLISYFIKQDLLVVKKSNLLLTSIILFFWSFFSFSIFNPAIDFNYQIIFWFLRGTIYKLIKT